MAEWVCGCCCAEWSWSCRGRGRRRGRGRGSTEQSGLEWTAQAREGRGPAATTTATGEGRAECNGATPVVSAPREEEPSHVLICRLLKLVIALIGLRLSDALGMPFCTRSGPDSQWTWTLYRNSHSHTRTVSARETPIYIPTNYGNTQLHHFVFVLDRMYSLIGFSLFRGSHYYCYYSVVSYFIN